MGLEGEEKEEEEEGEILLSRSKDMVLRGLSWRLREDECIEKRISCRSIYMLPSMLEGGLSDRFFVPAAKMGDCRIYIPGAKVGTN